MIRFFAILISTPFLAAAAPEAPKVTVTLPNGTTVPVTKAYTPQGEIKVQQPQQKKNKAKTTTPKNSKK